METNYQFTEIMIYLKRIESLLNDKKNVDEYLTLDKAAKYCSIATPTFRFYVSKGLIHGSKPGKNWIFLKSDLDVFLKQNFK